MKIIGEEWRPDQGDEAIVIVSGNSRYISVFSHPYNKSVGDILSEPLHIFGLIFIAKSTENEFKVKKQINGLGYEISARVVSKNNGILEVDGMFFELEDTLPFDIDNGCFVDFVCDRIDLW